MKNNLLKRAAKATAKHRGALGLFEVAAVELEDAALEHLAVASEASEIASRHEAITNEAHAASRAAKRSAAKLRELVQ